VKLHLGAFDHVVDGWINTDITPHIRVARLPGAAFLLRSLGLMSRSRYAQHRQGIFGKLCFLDVSRRFPWPDATAEAAYCSHLLEHLYREDARNCMAEVFRVLQPGGIFRIAVPDLDALVRAYDPSKPEAFLDPIFEIRQSRDKNRHHWHYNETSLRALLLEIGFSSVVRFQYREGRCPDVGVLDTRPESLFVEATK
jgi:SAM-dependent methyltransferase